MSQLLNTLKTGTLAAAIGAFACTAGTANAQLAGHNVILVHGFQFSDLQNPPSDSEVLNRRLMPEFWQQRAEGRLNWSSAERVEGGITQQIFEQAKQMAQQGTCNNGCVIVTHSTGDLVTRYFLENQESWMRNAGLEPLDIVAVLDFAGAGGGTELANLAVDIASSGSVPDWIKQAISGLFGMNLSTADISELGVAQDLYVSAARSLATAPSDIPRLRFSGSGGNFLINTIIPGADDATVPAHSSCGASSPAAIDSCSNHVKYSGKLTNVNGPSGLMHHHYPILMSKDADHGQVIKDEAKGKISFVLNNFNAGLNVDFATTRETVPWWQFWRETGTFQYVKNSQNRSISSVVYSTLNQ